jgi:hypothetical protein
MRALFLSFLFLIGCSVAAQSPVKPMEAPMMIRFDTAEAVMPWRAVNDGVMGGLSSGGPRFDAGAQALVFSGTINTNGGGFSSIRYPMTPGALSEADGMRLRVKSDGRAYRLTFRTSQRWRGRSVSWQIPIPRTEAGEWADVTAPFDQAQASIFGRRVRAGTFNPTDVREMGIILADGRDGPFRLDVAEISAATAPKNTP